MEESKRSLTEKTLKRYDRIAPVYNYIDKLSTPFWMREKAVSLASGDVLEVGVGTGANLPLYAHDCNVTAIDFSPRMLQIARLQADRLEIQVNLIQMDVQALTFADCSFDTVLATCVFCSVPDPVLGLKEIRRVSKKDGKIILLEHMRSENFVIGLMMDLFNPLFTYIIGNNINRKTVENINTAGLKIEEMENLKWGIFKLIVASP